MVEEIPRRNHTTACVFWMTAMMASGDDDEFLERKTPNQNGTRRQGNAVLRMDLYILNNLAVVSIMHIG